MSKLPEMTPNDAKERAKSIRCDDDVRQPAIGTWQLPLVARALQIAYRDGAAAERERWTEQQTKWRDALLIFGWHQKWCLSPEAEDCQCGWNQTKRALADLIDATGSVPGGAAREEAR